MIEYFIIKGHNNTPMKNNNALNHHTVKNMFKNQNKFDEAVQ